MPVARRTVDGDACVHQALTQIVNIVDPVSEMAKITPLAIFLGIPVIGEFDLWSVIIRCAQENKRETPALAVLAAAFHKPQMLAVELQAGINVRYPNHGVQEFHENPPSANKGDKKFFIYIR